MKQLQMPKLLQFIHWNDSGPMIWKTATSPKSNLNTMHTYRVSFAPTMKLQSQKEVCFFTSMCTKIRNYSWDSPLDFALLSRSLIRSLSTELDCSRSLSAIGESTPDCSPSLSAIEELTLGLGLGPPKRLKACIRAGVGWDFKGGRSNHSLMAGLRITEKSKITFIS
jgi:hypothetical protein